ncbi:MAG: RpiB/LacA/LacB family sugar-phosphate isomerase [Atopobiaceae bacterium]|nr:RpiB/LacA/LacB family sugar-phosphate isomerase [Atopobiaceae bacterium]
MRIAMANDHAGTALKNEIKAWLEQEGPEVSDFGTYDTEGCDLSDFVYPASMAVAKGECDRGIFVDGVGYGSAMIANKLRGIFACVCQDPVCAELSRQHNDANVLCLGGKIIGPVLAMAIVKTWMSTDAFTEEKYTRRRDKVAEIDREHTIAVK